MRFTQRVVAETAPVFEAILAQPFLQELAAGTLSEDRFVRYMQQDALYLAEYARVLTLLASKAETGEDLIAVADFGKGAILVERQLHEQFLAQFAAGPATEMGAACMAYTSFLTARVATRPLGVGLAAVLPCFKIYTDVGHRLLATAAKPNKYQAWLDTYAAPEFEALTEQSCALADKAYAAAGAAEQAEMVATYHNGARMEAWFWADAYAPGAGFLLG